MHYAEIYDKNNKLQKRDSKAIIDGFLNKIQWRKDGRDKLLDIGCGSGSCLMQCIYPLLPRTFDAVLGIDVSMEMIGYVSKRYEHYEKCAFKILDIAAKELPKDLCGQFDHVTSFFCLQWIHDQKTVLANIYNLLNCEGGNAILGILITHPFYEIYKIMHKSLKWTSYMQDIEKFISPLHYCQDPAADYLTALEEAGFTNCELTVYNNSFAYENLQQLKDFVKSVCPFLERLQTEQEEEFLNEFVLIAENRNHKLNIELVNAELIFHYKLLAVYAQKPANGDL